MARKLRANSHNSSSGHRGYQTWQHDQLEVKRALVTGGSTGIGFAIARSLAEAGAQVVLAGARTD
jgi:hypothetical protein